MLINASQHFTKGRPKNYLAEEHINAIADAYLEWGEIEGFSKVVSKDETVRNDYNLSPSRYVETTEPETHRPIGHILYDLEQAEKEAAEVDRELKVIFKMLGLKAEVHEG